MNRYAIALSHLPTYICGVDLPLKQVSRAIEQIAQPGGTLVGSFGMVHWNVQLALAIRFGVPVELVLLPEHTVSTVQKEFDKLKILSVIHVDSPKERDRKVFELSVTIFPIWCRSGGNMNRLLNSCDSARIDQSFDCSSFRFHAEPNRVLTELSPEIQSLPSDYLWHWTRSCDGSWPEETECEFCKAILNSETYPRSAIHTLKRIVDSRKIIGSGKSIGGEEPVVCFSENHPSEMVSHFVWRTGKHRMNFEPYGIGFPRKILESRGAVPVKYGESGSWDSMFKADRWINEKEWRIRGDLDFRGIQDSMIVVVRNHVESGLFDRFRVVSFE